MDLPSGFIKRIQDAFGERGSNWLRVLSDLIREASLRWGLSDIRPVSNLSYNFVAFARRGSYNVVLKIGVPDRELISEMAALRLFDGQAAVRLLEADEERAVFLLERVVPGEMLSTLKDDEHATNIAADVMLNLWRPAPADERLIQLTDWFAGLDQLRPAFNGRTGPFPQKIIERVEKNLPRLFDESNQPFLIHGDLHHFNILSSERGTTTPGWLAIDPKGVIGPAAYEAGPLLINPWVVRGIPPNLAQLTERRIAILSERLGFERERILEWALAHAVLSAWWDMQPDGKGGEHSIRCAEIFSGVQK